MDLTILQSFFNNNIIPKVKRQPKTFLGIAKQPHYENVLSNIYAFFFSVNEVHKLNDLFINSLLQVINSKLKNSKDWLEYMSNFEVAIEQPTKGGRIDLLLSNDENAIIIENKVYHHLNNNLKDYWDSISVTNKKIGVVLSLNTIRVEDVNFINITHLELMKKVFENSGLYLIEATDKYVVFLKDFYQNIINLSRSEMDIKELDFYFYNQEKINAAKDFLFSVKKHISNQVEIACENIDATLKLQVPKGNNLKRLRYYQSTKNSNLNFTIVFDELLKSEKRLFIIVELSNDLLQNRERFKSIIFTDKEIELLHPDFYVKKESWAHFAVEIYNLNNEQIKNLNQFISAKIAENGFLSIFKKLEDVI